MIITGGGGTAPAGLRVALLIRGNARKKPRRAYMPWSGSDGNSNRKECALNNRTALASNVRRVGHLDLAGAGQVTVQGRYAYVGHMPNRTNLGTTILDITDPA